ncbi:MAG: cbiX [Bacilli bacterium]|nr:cbiX [Bacilli bacterium]
MAYQKCGRAIIVVAHGSRVDAANQELSKVVQDLQQLVSCDRVMPAYLELASPDVPAAIDQAVLAGAAEVSVVPYFLLFGGHIQEDLPRIAADAALRHPHARILLAGHIGFHPLLVDIVLDRLSVLMKQ